LFYLQVLGIRDGREGVLLKVIMVAWPMMISYNSSLHFAHLTNGNSELISCMYRKKNWGSKFNRRRHNTRACWTNTFRLLPWGHRDGLDVGLGFLHKRGHRCNIPKSWVCKSDLEGRSETNLPVTRSAVKIDRSDDVSSPLLSFADNIGFCNVYPCIMYTCV
jgi:hypothetical protein